MVKSAPLIEYPITMNRAYVMPEEPDIVVIELTKNYVTKIDLEDYVLVRGLRWFADVSGLRVYVSAYLVDGKKGRTRLHRYLLGEPDAIVDHRNGDSLDNRRDNLRACTDQQNAWNQQKRIGTTLSKYKGIHLNRPQGRWYAQITVAGQKMSLGGAPSEEEAARIYDSAAKKHFGQYASLNFPE